MEHGPTLLAVHPHPDDESIACGGVLAKAHDDGVRTVVVTCTGGEEGENLAGIDLGDDDLATHRRRELASALVALDVTAHHWLGYRDSGMAGQTSNERPDSFHRADADAAALRLATIIRAERPHVVVSDDERGTYGHPDHIKAHEVTVRAVRLAADPAAPLEGDPWKVRKRYVHTLGIARLRTAHQAWFDAGLPSPFGEEEQLGEVGMGVPDELVTTEVDVTPFLVRKQAALRAHRSQIGEDSFFLNTPETIVTQLFGIEQFVLEEGVLGAERPERDLFSGIERGSVS